MTCAISSLFNSPTSNVSIQAVHTRDSQWLHRRDASTTDCMNTNAQKKEIDDAVRANDGNL